MPEVLALSKCILTFRRTSCMVRLAVRIKNSNSVARVGIKPFMIFCLSTSNLSHQCLLLSFHRVLLSYLLNHSLIRLFQASCFQPFSCQPAQLPPSFSQSLDRPSYLCSRSSSGIFFPRKPSLCSHSTLFQQITILVIIQIVLSTHFLVCLPNWTLRILDTRTLSHSYFYY